jgi:hypothetical protein
MNAVILQTDALYCMNRYEMDSIQVAEVEAAGVVEETMTMNVF